MKSKGLIKLMVVILSASICMESAADGNVRTDWSVIDLPDGVKREMVKIPAETFTIGSSEKAFRILENVEI